MLTWADLTDDELAECPASVRDTIARLNARVHATCAALRMVSPGLTFEQACTEACTSMDRWEHGLAEDEMRELLLSLAIFEVLREHNR